MATYKTLYVDPKSKTRWCVMAPASLWEVLRTVWMIWRYPDRMGILVGVADTFAATNFNSAKDAAGDALDAGAMLSPGAPGAFFPSVSSI